MVKSVITPPPWRRSWPPILAGLAWSVMIVALTAWWMHQPPPPPWSPPMTVHSLAVVVEDGVPVRVVEHRTTDRAFDGMWAVRVLRVDHEIPEIICTRPPDAKGYPATYSTLGESFLSPTWAFYVGDPTGACLADMTPGKYIIVTERHDITGGIREALPLVSSQTFEVTR